MNVWVWNVSCIYLCFVFFLVFLYGGVCNNFGFREWEIKRDIFVYFIKIGYGRF